MVFNWGLSDNKSNVSRTLLSILADLNAYVDGLQSSDDQLLQYFIRPFGIVLSVQITYNITVSLTFLSFI